MIITRCFLGIFAALVCFCANAECKTEFDLTKWIAANDKPYPGEPADFFKAGNARLSGVVKDYDRECGFDNMQVFTNDGFTGKERVVNVPVNEDGTFDVEIPLSFPRLVYFRGLNGRYRFIYLEPERDLNLVVGTDTIYRYGGLLGEINRQLADAPQYPAANNYWMAKELTPNEASGRLKEISDNYQSRIDDYINEEKINPVAVRLLNDMVKMNYLEELLMYDLNYGYMQYDDSLASSLKEPMTAEFFSPFKEVLRENDSRFISANFRTLPFAFSSLFDRLGFKDVYEVKVIDGGLLFLKEKGVKLNEKEMEAARWIEENLGKRFFFDEEEWQAYFKRQSLAEEAARRCGLMDEYTEFRNTLPPLLFFPSNSMEQKNKTELLKSFIGIDFSPLLWQMCLGDYLCRGQAISKNCSTKEWTSSLIESMKNDGVLTCKESIDGISEFFTCLYDDEPYELPDDENGAVMKKIIEPYRGKYIMIDFWATYCGPCRYEIEENAEIYRRNVDHPQFQFIFITANSESPRKLYDEYAAKHLDGLVSLYLPGGDFARLRELFNFNGVPRQVLIGPDGKVIDDDLKAHHISILTDRLNKYGVILK